jgi:hypothetical protein
VRHQPHRVLRALEPRLHPAEYFADVSRGAPEQPALEDGARFLNMLMKPCEVKNVLAFSKMIAVVRATFRTRLWVLLTLLFALCAKQSLTPRRAFPGFAALNP